MVIPLDDFWIILGMDFLQGTNVLPMPYLRSVGESPCMALAIKKGNQPIGFLLALPVKKGLKNGEATFLLALCMEDQEITIYLMLPLIDGVLKSLVMSCQ